MRRLCVYLPALAAQDWARYSYWSMMSTYSLPIIFFLGLTSDVASLFLSILGWVVMLQDYLCY